jgi:hypothetical protein
MFMQHLLRLIASVATVAALAGAANAQDVRMLGRTEVLPNGAFAIQWPSSGFEATFEGTTLKATIYDWGSNWLNVEVDGVVSKLALNEDTQTYTLFSGARGTHAIKVTRRTGTPVGVTRIERVEADGPIQPTPAPAHRILVIGDDLASGHGVEGSDEKCTYTHATQNSDLAYPVLLAKALGADLHVVAADGYGLIRNYAGNGAAMNTIAWQTLVDDDRAWAALTYQPEVIVIGLGTADFTASDPGDGFDDAYVFLLKRLRIAYPDALIVGSVGGTLWGKRYAAAKTSISDAIEKVSKDGDEKVRFVEFKLTAGPGRYGCDYHPGKGAQAEMAAALQAEVEKSLGWRPAGTIQP